MRKKLIALIIGLLVITGVAHGINMWGYPAYFDDEGTYMAQAMAITEQGKLAPYTYWYDHSPVGWMVIAGWLALTGGAGKFGMAINSGRMLMLLVHVAAELLVVFITWRVTRKVSAVAIAGGLFAVSPLAVPLSRMVFLDNIMMLFALAAWALIEAKKRLLYFFPLSGLLLGLAVLTKETAIFLMPAYLVAIWAAEQKGRRVFGIMMWLITFGLTVAVYPLFALL